MELITRRQGSDRLKVGMVFESLGYTIVDGWSDDGIWKYALALAVSGSSGRARDERNLEIVGKALRHPADEVTANTS